MLLFILWEIYTINLDILFLLPQSFQILSQIHGFFFFCLSTKTKTWSLFCTGHLLRAWGLPCSVIYMLSVTPLNKAYLLHPKAISWERLLGWGGTVCPPSLLHAGVLSGLSLSGSYTCCPVSVISKVTCCLWKMLFPESRPQPLDLMSFLTCRSHRFPKPWGEGCDKDTIILSVWVPRCVQQKWPRLFRKIILQKHLEILQNLQEKKKRIREKQEWERWDLPNQWACPLLPCLAFPWTSCCHSWNLALSCAQIMLHCSLFDCCISDCPQTCV